MYVDGINVIRENGVLKGDEVDSLKTFVRTLNASVKIIPLATPKHYNDFSAIFSEALDFPFIRRFPTIETLQKIDLIQPYSKDNLQAIVPQASLIPAYTYILMLYDRTPLLIFGGLVIAASLVVKLGNSIAITNALFKIIGCVFSFGSVVPKFVTRPCSTKIAFLSIIWFGIFNSVMFQSSLTSTLLTKKFYPEVNTLRALDKSNMTIYVDSVHYYLLPKRIKAQAVQTTSKEITQMIQNGSENAYIVLESFIKSQIMFSNNGSKRQRHFSKHFHVMRQSVVPGYTTYIFSKWNPYIHKIGEFLRKIVMAQEHKSLKTWRKPSYNSQADVTEKFTFQHWIGIFATLIVGHCIATIVFIIETFIKKIHFLKQNC